MAVPIWWYLQKWQGQHDGPLGSREDSGSSLKSKVIFRQTDLLQAIECCRQRGGGVQRVSRVGG